MNKKELVEQTGSKEGRIIPGGYRKGTLGSYRDDHHFRSEGR